VIDPKPSPDMLLEILNEFNVLLDESVMVGDASVDQEMANAIDMDFIGVKTGLIDLNVMTNTANSFWVEDMYEVKNILCV
jgi:phosphoglycolate phosphatase